MRSQPRERSLSSTASRAFGAGRSLLLEPLEERRLLFGGIHDETFDTDGIVQTSLAATHDQAEGLVLQSDGKMVAVGTAFDGQRQVFALARYNVDGTLDTTFDGDGRALTDFGGSAGAMAVAVQPDGKIVVAGYAYQGGAFQFALARYNTDGSLDTSFDGDGRVTTVLGSSSDAAFALAIQSDGKIVAAGESFDGPALGTSGSDFALVRYNVNGSLDAGFGQGGIVRTPIGPKNDRIEAIGLIEGRLPGDTRIVVAGWTTLGGRRRGSRRSVVRRPPTGCGAGSIRCGGKPGSHLRRRRHRHHCLRHRLRQGHCASAVQSGGQILVGGSVTTGNEGVFVLARIATGQLDPSFGTAGVTRTSFGAAAAGANAIATLDDQIVLAGFARFNNVPRPASRSSGIRTSPVRRQWNPGRILWRRGPSYQRHRLDRRRGDCGGDSARRTNRGRRLCPGPWAARLRWCWAYRDSLPPVAVDDLVQTTFAPITIDVLSNDSDPEGFLFPGSVTITSPPTNGTAVVNVLTGQITYTPFDYGFDDDEIRYTVRGRYGDVSNEATVTINELMPPTAVDDSVARGFSSGAVWSNHPPLSIPVLDNDSDADGSLDPATVTITSPPGLGTVTVDPLTGVVSLRPSGLRVRRHDVSVYGARQPGIDLERGDRFDLGQLCADCGRGFRESRQLVDHD